MRKLLMLSAVGAGLAISRASGDFNGGGAGTRKDEQRHSRALDNERRP